MGKNYTNWFRTLFFLIFLMFLVWSVFLLLGIFTSCIEGCCQKNDIKRDICLLEKSTKELLDICVPVLPITSSTRNTCQKLDSPQLMLCDNIKTDLLRDACFLQESRCGEIINPYFGYLCYRMDSRHHMWTFTSISSEEKNNLYFKVQRCEVFTGYAKLICIYEDILKGKDVIYASNTVCNQFNGNLKGECQFMLAIKMISRIKQDQKQVVEDTLNLCSLIEDYRWRSECYYLIADELSFIGDRDLFPQMINACRNSNDARNFQCISHVAFNLNIEDIKFYCDLVSQKEKKECINGFGHTLITKGFTIPNAINQCNSFEKNEEQDFCMFGILWGQKNSTELKELCKTIPNGYKIECYKQYVEVVFYDTKLDANFIKTFKHCDNVDYEYLQDCYTHTGKKLLYLTEFDIKLSSELCNSSSYSKWCLDGLNEIIESSNFT